MDPDTQCQPYNFTLATWNVNSLRQRHSQVMQWLATHNIDILCLQELKLTDETFPIMDYTALGYQALWIGQKSYNGVAILAKSSLGPLQWAHKNLPQVEHAPQARMLIAYLPLLELHVGSLYVPNGQDILSDKFTYKRRWLAHLTEFLSVQFKPTESWILTGDFNLAPDDRDVYDPKVWKDTVICHADVRQSWQDLLNLGFSDALRLHHQDAGIYTYWDYRQMAFVRNMGLRIDHTLVSPTLLNSCLNSWVDRQMRKETKPSDHAPFVTQFYLPRLPKTQENSQTSLAL